MNESDLSARKIFFLDFFGRLWRKTDGFKKPRKNFFFEPKGHFRSFFRKFFVSMITSGKFCIDPENLSP